LRLSVYGCGEVALIFAPFMARLKSCPDTKQTVKPASDTNRSFSAICYQDSLGGSAREMKQRCYYVRLTYECLRKAMHGPAYEMLHRRLGR
jgi:hypothetical protein